MAERELGEQALQNLETSRVGQMGQDGEGGVRPNEPTERPGVMTLSTSNGTFPVAVWSGWRG